MKNPPSTIKRLVSDLSGMENGRLEPEGVADLIGLANFSATDLGPFLHFKDERYTRNLVYNSATFEVIVLCWPPGSSTPIHDHGEQWGWVRVLKGALEETRYSSQDQPDHLDETQVWSPKVHSQQVIPAGRAVAAVNSKYGIHRLAALDEPTVSLHVYAKPLASCLVFGAPGGQIERKQLSFDTTPGSPAKQLS